MERLYLAESMESNEDKLTHLEHAEDHVINSGGEGFTHAYNNLMDVHNKLSGKNNDTRVTMKYDGSPSVVFGHHPENGKFFVASKSAFNKNPKINYTPEDVEANHGHAPGLVKKLKAALEHLPKVTPKQGVYQGDIMHTPDDVKYNKGKVSFTPNTIEYSTDANSKEGHKALNSKIGVVPHTAYRGGPSLEDMKAEYAPDMKDFNEHPDVHVISSHHDLKKVKYSPRQQSQFKKHLEAASDVFSRTHPDAHAAIEPHRLLLKTYINSTVRKGTTPDHEGFKGFLADQRDKSVASVKTPKAQDAKREMYNSKIMDVEHNKNHFNNVLAIHHHLQKAKDVLTNALSSHSTFENHIKGKKTKPEGFVVVRNNRPTKFVDRAEFSRANFEPRG